MAGRFEQISGRRLVVPVQGNDPRPAGSGNEGKALIDAAVRLKPDVHERLRDMARIWHVPDPHIEHIAEGLRKAGAYRACATVFVTKSVAAPFRWPSPLRLSRREAGLRRGPLRS